MMTVAAAPAGVAVSPNAGVTAPRRAVRALDAILLCVGITASLAVLTLVVAALLSQHANYSVGLESAAAGKDINYGALLTFARAWDFALAKTAALFLSFLLVFVGALYVLRDHEVNFSVSIENDQLGKGALSSSSPGLVLSALGVVLLIVVLYSKSFVAYEAPDLPAGKVLGPQQTTTGAAGRL